LLTCGVALQAASQRASADPNERSLILVFLCFATVGAVLASRRAHNAAGWICSAIGFTAIVGGFSESYGAYAVEHPGSLPAAGLVAWPGAAWLWYVTVALMVVFLPLLFPTGHLPRRVGGRSSGQPAWRWPRSA
jgi:hypothetical protein